MNGYLQLIIGGLSAAFPYALLGLLVGIGIVWFLKKKGYLERNNLFLKVITKLYYIYIPLVFFFATWSIGSISLTIKSYEQTLQEVIVDIEQEAFPSFLAHVNRRVDHYLKENKIPSNAAIVEGFLGDYLNENTPSLYQSTMKIALTTLLEYTIGKDGEHEQRVKALAGGLSEPMYQKGFDFLKSEVSRRVNQFLFFLLFPLIIGVIGALLLPLVEIVIGVKFFGTKERLEKEEAT